MRYKNHLLLLLTAFIWGCAFVAQSAGMDYVGPFTFTALRSYLGGLVLLPLIYFFDHTMDFKDKKLWAGGIACGIVLGLASALQQFGIQYTTVGKAGFITALYIIVVPFFSLFLGKKLSPKIGISVVLAVIGLYLLCMTGSFSLGKGDLLVCACACVFALHILVIDHYSPLVDGVKMSCIQFFTCALLNTIPMFLFEDVSMHNIMVGCVPILYAGLLSSGAGYTLQIIGQKGMNPTVASILLSMESVFSVLAGWVILGQSLTIKEGLGCVLMFIAIIIAQLPYKKSIQN